MNGYPTVYNDIIFIEAPFGDGQVVSKVSADLSFKIGAHLKNLNDVKADLAAKAKQLGCNLICEFKYGQKSRLLAIDDVAFFGSGIAMKVSPETYSNIIEYIRKRDYGRT